MPTVLAQPAIPTTTFGRVYVPAALLIALLAFVGFWPTYFGPLLAGTLDTIPLIHLHAAVYVLGVVVMLTMRLCLPLRKGPTWLAFSGWLAGFYT